MEGTKVFLVILALGMVITGSINTLSTKWADTTSSKGIDGTSRVFSHPFFQAAGMFLGELSCLPVFYIIFLSSSSSRSSKVQDESNTPKSFSPFIFVLPALCDMTATSLMYLGLTWTYASVFQMLRGSVMIFTGILSVIFLKKTLYAFKWFGMFVVFCGLVLVGLASVVAGSDGVQASRPLLGDAIVISAQLVAAFQMVVEEKFISKYNVPPLQVVGFEGLWGLIMISGLLFGFYYLPCPSGFSCIGAGNHFENSLDAFVQIKNSKVLMVALLGNVVSIAFFNFFGVSITKYSSATTRMVLDNIRTLVIWGVGLAVGWQGLEFKQLSLQIAGFVLLILGTAIYNEILKLPFLPQPPVSSSGEQSPLIPPLEDGNTPDERIN